MKKALLLFLAFCFAVVGLMAQSRNNQNKTLIGCSFEFDITTDNNYTGRGNKDEVLLNAKLLPSSDLNLSSVSVDMTGTTNISDVEKIKVYQTSTSTFDSRKAMSYTKIGEATPDPSGQITFNVMGSVNGGSATYLWLTYDIASDAKEGNVVAAKISSISTGESFLQTIDEVVATREILLARKLLYAPGDYGSKNYRIPAIVTAKDGSLIVGIDKRKNNQSDLPEDIDVLINRSTNNGVDSCGIETIFKVMLLHLVGCGNGYRADLVQSQHGEPELVVTLADQHDAVASLNAKRFEVVSTLGRGTLDVAEREAALGHVAGHVQHSKLIGLFSAQSIDNIKCEIEVIGVLEGQRLQNALVAFAHVHEVLPYALLVVAHHDRGRGTQLDRLLNDRFELVALWVRHIESN